MPLLLLAIGPGIFWLWYFLAKDRLRPEPRSLVRRVFFVGVIAAFAAGLLEAVALGAAGLSLEAGMPETLIAAAFIGLIEEGVKFAAVLVTAYRHTHFDEVIDGIVYAVTASLGFATIENVFYVFNGGVGVGVARALLSVPGHAFFGAVMGYYLGVAKFSAHETRWLFTGLGLATLAHTIYDALVFSQSAYALAVIPFVLLLWRRSVILTRRAHTMDDPGTRAS